MSKKNFSKFYLSRYLGPVSQSQGLIVIKY